MDNAAVYPFHAAVKVERWEAPIVEGPCPTGDRRDAEAQPPLLTAEQIEEIQRQAYDEGFARGKSEGWTAGQKDIKEVCQFIVRAATALAEPLNQLDRRVDEEFAALALHIAQQVIRREIRTEPGEVIAIMREALSSLPVATTGIRVYMHPEDAKWVMETMKLDGEQCTWRLIDDPALSRGGCRVETETSIVDASVEKRIAAVAAMVLGDQRGSESSKNSD